MADAALRADFRQGAEGRHRFRQGLGRRYRLGATALTLLSAVVADGSVAWHLAAPSVWLMGGCEMADDKGIALARRSRSAPKAMRISPTNNVNVALPLSMIRADEPAKMRAGDWVSVAGLVITVVGFGVAIRQLSRIADALGADQASHRASREERESRLLAGLLRLTSGLAENISQGPTSGRSQHAWSAHALSA